MPGACARLDAAVIVSEVTIARIIGSGICFMASVRPQTAVFQRNVGVLALSARMSERLAKRFAEASRVGVAVKGGGIV